jgi:nicotinamidase/pyrazinamidase
MKTPIYVDVDTQRDFCAPDGALFVRSAPAVMPAVRRLLAHAADRGHLVVGSVDTHDFTAWEFDENGGPFPPHCVKGTAGWLKMEGTLPERAVFVPNVAGQATAAPVPAEAHAVLFEKEVYSLFANPAAEPTLAALLAARGLAQEDVELVVFGVATDYCVSAAALGLRERGYPVAVVTDAVAAVDEGAGQAALQEMAAAGCRLVTSRSLV